MKDKYNLVLQIKRKSFEGTKKEMKKREISDKYLSILSVYELRDLHNSNMKRDGLEAETEDELSFLEMNRNNIRKEIRKREDNV